MITQIYEVACAVIIATLLGPAVPPESDPYFEERIEVCEAIRNEADTQDIDADIALAVGWRESMLTDAPENSSGCIGAMQIKKKYWCPNAAGEWSATRADGVEAHCNFIERGVFALKWYLAKHKTLEAALCGYGWGNCDAEGRDAYVKHTLKTLSRIRRLVASPAPRSLP